MDEENSTRGNANLNEKMKGIKSGLSLNNPLFNVLKLGSSFEVDEDYIVLPSARASDRPKHFESVQEERTQTDPDLVESEKYNTGSNKLSSIIGGLTPQKYRKADTDTLISTKKVISEQ